MVHALMRCCHSFPRTSIGLGRHDLAGTILVLPMMTKPASRIYDADVMFELAYTLLVAYELLRITILDVHLRHLYMHEVPYYRNYSADRFAMQCSHTVFVLCVTVARGIQPRASARNVFCNGSTAHLLFQCLLRSEARVLLAPD